MEKIWAPWRIKYIENSTKETGCIFCNKPAQNNDEANCILHRSHLSFIILNTYPYSNGHLMITPYQHTANLDDLTNDEMLDLMTTTRLAVNWLKLVYHPDGFNIGINMGRVAGAGIADHVHIHVVPRWNGDTNFMSVVGDTRVMPESLASVYKRLKAAANSLPNT